MLFISRESLNLLGKPLIRCMPEGVFLFFFLPGSPRGCSKVFVDSQTLRIRIRAGCRVYPARGYTWDHIRAPDVRTSRVCPDHG